MKIAIIVLCTLASVLAASPVRADNARLTSLYEEDQSDRKPSQRPLSGDQIVQRDVQRQETVIEIMRAGGVVSANDFFHAAMVFQHSDAADDNALAYGLAVTAARIDPSNKMAKWLSAAAWDRALMRKNKPQWYGTQFVKNSDTGKWELYRVDEDAVTDEDRERTGVPPLAKQREREKQLNAE